VLNQGLIKNPGLATWLGLYALRANVVMSLDGGQLCKLNMGTAGPEQVLIRNIHFREFEMQR
jgi:hypothetical protein